jgi:hypothetical protein
MIAISRFLLGVVVCLTTVPNSANANSILAKNVRTAPLIHVLLDEYEARYCLAKYNREVEKSKELIAKNGSMTEFFYAQRKLRRAYWELDPDRMIYDQKYIDLWEHFDIGQIDHKTALSITMKIMNEGYDNRNEKMKSCR